MNFDLMLLIIKLKKIKRKKKKEKKEFHLMLVEVFFFWNIDI